ncbi:Predicted arabinose efflux permease, MFS family [Faunimonas pinastri]|uniref:Predicted arabinose efflux permease, MFS family n=1 Tax=Faunimonas pinastri TaxID=1855383 RepID=A0A1H9INN5_9HYPH|nr:MFS transporter [Faunimonas pinastri]SEQ76223.1 Predicted arabinose efflux permease, MFS family [Faunimonas pinastri]
MSSNRVAYAGPSSSPLERDARLVSSDARIAPGEIALGVVIGRTAEFFDFFVYGIASVLIFPRVFFPMVDAPTGTLYSFAIFALAFLSRPVGSVIFMAVDRAYGRGTKLTIAMFLLGGSTAVIAFLPGYDQIGPLSIYLLAICRLGQGFALGGAWDGLASLLALNAPQNKRAWYAMMPQLGAPLGFMLASGLFWFFVSNLSTDDLLEFGWRYPFFVAFAINVVALFARLRLVVTEEFARLLENHDLEPCSISDLWHNHRNPLIIGAFVPLATFALFHLVTIFPLSWVTLFAHRSAGAFLGTEFAGAVLGAITIVIAGVIADRIGRRRMLAICAVLIAIFSFVTPLLLGGGEVGQSAFVILGFGLLGLSFSQAAGAVTSRFPSEYRYTGAALTSDFSWLVGAGFAPLVALWLSTHVGLYMTGAYLLSGAVCTLLALSVNRRLEITDR